MPAPPPHGDRSAGAPAAQAQRSTSPRPGVRSVCDQHRRRSATSTTGLRTPPSDRRRPAARRAPRPGERARRAIGRGRRAGRRRTRAIVGDRGRRRCRRPRPACWCRAARRPAPAGSTTSSAGSCTRPPPPTTASSPPASSANRHSRQASASPRRCPLDCGTRGVRSQPWPTRAGMSDARSPEPWPPSASGSAPTYLRPADQPTGVVSARGVHHLALLSSDVERSDRVLPGTCWSSPLTELFEEPRSPGLDALLLRHRRRQSAGLLLLPRARPRRLRRGPRRLAPPRDLPSSPSAGSTSGASSTPWAWPRGR